jgi:hypothetical protein
MIFNEILNKLALSNSIGEELTPALNKLKGSLIILESRNNKAVEVGFVTFIGKTKCMVKVVGYKTNRHLVLSETKAKYLALNDNTFILITQRAIEILLGNEGGDSNVEE